MVGILDCFPKGKVPREQQKDILLAIEKEWKSTDVFVIVAPTATGKSAISITLSNYIHEKFKDEAAILTPNNLLTEQYKTDYPKLAAAYGSTYHKCKDTKFKNCRERRQFAESAKIRKYCDGCLYSKQQTRHNYLTYKFPYIVNYHKYVSLKRTSAGKAARSYLIIDEAHLLLDTVKSFNTYKVWHHDFPYSEFKNREELLRGFKNTQLDTFGINRFQKAVDMLESNPPKFILKEEKQKYYNEERACLVFNPITIKDLTNPIILDSTKKVFLLSATISNKDIEELGLAGRRITYINADSCIPPSSRPIVSIPVARVSGSNLLGSRDKLVDNILEIADKYKEGKGLIHATYAQARLFKQSLKDNPRFIFHTNKDKTEVYQSFRNLEDNKILVASGMYEGIDLPYEAGQFQIVTKIPYLNLGEPSVRYMAELDKDWYQWQAIKTVLQAAGRICRTPTDYGITYILDSMFQNLYTNNLELFPLWFREAVQLREET